MRCRKVDPSNEFKLRSGSILSKPHATAGGSRRIDFSRLKCMICPASGVSGIERGTMKKILGLILLGTFVTATWAMAASSKAGSKSVASTQPAAKTASKYTPETGDKDLDVVLSNLNVEAGVQTDAFVSELSISYSIPKVQIEELVYNMKMPFGDVFVSVWIASSMKKPLSVLVKEYDVNKDKGWGVMAKNLGIKPGSDAFHTLKKDSSVELDLAQKRNKEKKTEKPEKTEKSGSKGKSKK
jgi:hypothetical protein